MRPQLVRPVLMSPVLMSPVLMSPELVRASAWCKCVNASQTACVNLAGEFKPPGSNHRSPEVQACCMETQAEFAWQQKHVMPATASLLGASGKLSARPESGNLPSCGSSAISSVQHCKMLDA